MPVEKFGPNPTQPTENGAYRSVVTYLYTQKLSRTYSQPDFNLFVFFTDHCTYYKQCQVGREVTFNRLLQPNFILVT